jgi:crotonobetainyl-CoA:carnitine CoA-transferase CaiB-like acyl-CoA transferase
VSTLAFALLGADVIKVEDTGQGDYQRSFGVQVDGASASHQTFNRGKRSICLDLKSESDRATFESLVRTADVLIESFRPGVLERLDYSPDRLLALRPNLIITRVSGYGSTGPLANSAGHDVNYLAFSGHLERLGLSAGPPVMPHVPFADVIGGAFIPAMMTIAYVHRAKRDGVGAVIDCSMADAMALMPNTLVTDLLAGGLIEPRGCMQMGGALACYCVYEAADGYVALGALEERFWQAFCDIAGFHERYRRDHLGVDRQRELKRLVRSFFIARTRDEIATMFANVDACVTPVLSYEEMLQTQHAKARGYVAATPNGRMPMLEFPAMIDGARLTVERSAPFQGEHTEEIRNEAQAVAWGGSSDR